MKGTLALTAMRNEGPFILEWIAWHKMLGFEEILILHNNCTDHSPQMLRQLQRLGEITMKRHRPGPGVPPQVSAYKVGFNHPLVKACDWVYICDTDEFLAIHKGDGLISDLLPEGEPDFAGMAVHWLIYGDSDTQNWDDAPVHRQFLWAAQEKTQQNACFKCLVYKPRRFLKFGAHIPHGWRGDGAWNQGANRWVLSDGTPLSEYDPDKRHLNGTSRDRITHRDAQVNHYILQSREKYRLKKGLTSATDFGERYTDDFRNRFNHNLVKNPLALRYADRFDAEYARLLALPGIGRLHHLCCADFVAALCESQGNDPKTDARFRRHSKRAASLPKHW